MTYKISILLLNCIISIVNSDTTTVSPLESKCTCVDFQQCHHSLANLYYGNELTYTSDKIPYRQSKCNDTQICCNQRIKDMQSELQLKTPLDKHDYTQCGVHNSSIPMVVGKNAQAGEFPWMVAVLEIDEANKYEFISGGTIIHPRVVLTTAHGLYNYDLMIFKTNLKIRVGSNQQTNNSEYEIDVQNVFPHENFQYDRSHNNIAILLLENDIIFGPNVRTICLPPSNVNFELRICVAAGFKETDSNKILLNENLKKINLPLLTNDNCQRKFRLIPTIVPYFQLDESLLCAGGIKRKDNCDSDKGSTLICGNKYYYLVGMKAGSYGCSYNIPAIFTNVTNFYQWVSDTFSSLGLETKWFTPK